MKNYSTLFKELRKLMKNTTATRYWGTLILLIIGAVLVAMAWRLPEIITALG